MPMSRKYTRADLHVQLTGEAMAEIGRKILAERAAWRKALGVPRGFEIPEALPATAAECEAELALVTHLGAEALRRMSSIPPGPERESAGLAIRGGAYLLLEDYDHAIADFTEVRRLDPRDPSALTGLASAYTAKGDYQRALELY